LLIRDSKTVDPGTRTDGLLLSCPETLFDEEEEKPAGEETAQTMSLMASGIRCVHYNNTVADLPVVP